MRLISWNMGCAYGSRYKQSNPRTWRQLLAWEPDIALVQETLHPGGHLDPDTFLFSPYGWCTDQGRQIGTLVYSRTGGLRQPDTSGQFLPVLPGQVTLAELRIGDTDVPMLLASVHADTRAVDRALLNGHDLDGVAGSHTTKIYPVDLILAELAAITPGRRFIIGGDLNVSVRFDDRYTRGSDLYGSVEWFGKARDAGWRNAHRKFHAGDQRTLFRPGKPDEHFQIDHLFSDHDTWAELSRCDVLAVPLLEEFTDHAPLLLQLGTRQDAGR